MACEGRVYDLARRTPNLTNTSLYFAVTSTYVYTAVKMPEKETSQGITRGTNLEGGRRYMEECRFGLPTLSSIQRKQIAP